MLLCFHIEMNFWVKVLLKTSSAFLNSILCCMLSKILDLDGINIRIAGDKVTRAASALFPLCFCSANRLLQLQGST